MAPLVADTSARVGRLDVLVNNVRMQHVTTTEEFSNERWNVILAVDLS
jgi:NAD(P)-dependent dehydrogenase (short-subunit alcohol dehydrogenase family)